MTHSHTTKTELIRSWAILMGLSLATMLAGRVGEDLTLGPLWAMALLGVAGIKARLILARFLNLQQASGDWNSAFTVFLVILQTALLVAFLAVNLPVFNQTAP
jgi:heme/copper-type cytochrome/quinol oxidase subunit 4